jgi:hypothetical protein
MTLDISRDYRYFDGVETLTFTDLRTGTTYPVPYCLRSELTYREMQFVSGLGHEVTALPVDVPGPELGGYVPKQGDQFSDGSVSYLIQSANYNHLTEQWRVIGTKAVS